MVSDLYKKMGFHEVEKDRYEVNVTEYEKHKTSIQKQEKEVQEKKFYNKKKIERIII